MIPARHAIIIGAGAAGLSAAIDLSRQGLAVSVLDRADEPGGKMRQVDVGGALVDAGPTVFTMRWIFEALFADAGRSLDRELRIVPATRLARHAWSDGGALDLHADIQDSAQAIGDFSGARDARGYLSFCKASQAMYATLQDSFIAAQKPGPLGLVNRVGLTNLVDLWRTRPFVCLWSELERHFEDPRLRQLFGRYATYVGSSPFLVPATLMLIAHVEQDGVWQIHGGMRALAAALQRVAEDQGAQLRFGAEVAQILIEDGKACGVRLASGEVLRADAIVFNGDASALASGLLGEAARPASRITRRENRSLSAVTWCLNTQVSGFDLDYHNVFFADDYRREFDTIFKGRDICERPTVYICAQDRLAGAMPTGPERLLVLVNAPPDGDTHPMGQPALDALTERTFRFLRTFGLQFQAHADAVITSPAGFEQRFPGTGGALYGRANHSPMASFARPGSTSAIARLYLAGGSVHPGPGVPMAVMSGRLAAASVIAELSA